MGSLKYCNGFGVTTHEESLEIPLEWKRPKMIFVNSMSDLFHEQIPLEFIHKVFDVMRRSSWHQFQVLTKRSQRLIELAPFISWPQNVWMGVSVENEAHLYRVDHLRQIEARIKFLSLEPLLGPLPSLDLNRIDWVIVGGESGPGARSMITEWVTEIRDQCLKANVPFFFKQWGGLNKKRAGRLLEGRTWNDTPTRLFSKERITMAS